MPLANFGLKEIRMIFVGHVIRRRLIQNPLTKDSTNKIFKSISLNLDMAF